MGGLKGTLARSCNCEDRDPEDSMSKIDCRTSFARAMFRDLAGMARPRTENARLRTRNGIVSELMSANENSGRNLEGARPDTTAERIQVPLLPDCRLLRRQSVHRSGDSLTPAT